MGNITTATGTRMYIGPAITSAIDTEGEFAPLTYVEIGEIENMGAFGDESNLVNAASLSDARVRKLKGARDAGTMPLRCFRDPLDAGQTALYAAEATKYEYAFKIQAADAPTPAYDDSLYYFKGLVSSAREEYGGNDTVVATVFNIAINSRPIKIPAALS